MFKQFTAAEYRALDHDAFVARKQEVMDLMNADTLPEGVTDDMLFAEADLIEADTERRSRLNKLHNAKVEAVANGAGKVIATTEERSEDTEAETRQMPRTESFSSRNREMSQHYTDTKEYRTALAKHILGQERMPSHMAAKALQERANVPVDMADSFTNITDPTFQNTMTSLIMVPMTLAEEVQKELRETSILLPRVNQTYIQGGMAVSEYDLQVTGAWISDKEVSPYQSDYDPEIFYWGYNQFEARFARTFLAQAIMSDTYTSQLAPALAECYANAVDKVIYDGTGVGQPRGITNDLRLLGSDGLGLDSPLDAFSTQRTGTGKGRALVITVNEDQVDDWKWWSTILYNTKFNRLYRNKGALLIADGTWGNHVNVLHDDNNRPISLMNPLNDEQTLTLRGVGNVIALPNTTIKPFDDAEVGDIVGIYGDLHNYTMNFQPGMPLSTVTWDDHETNTHKTKVLTAMDGRVHNPFGWLFIKKGPSA